MRRVSIRELRANMKAELRDVPFIITKSGCDIAMCTPIIDGLVNLPPTKCECIHNSEEKTDSQPSMCTRT